MLLVQVVRLSGPAARDSRANQLRRQGRLNESGGEGLIHCHGPHAETLHLQNHLDHREGSLGNIIRRKRQVLFSSMLEIQLWCGATYSATRLRISSTGFEGSAKTMRIALDCLRTASVSRGGWFKRRQLGVYQLAAAGEA